MNSFYKIIFLLFILHGIFPCKTYAQKVTFVSGYLFGLEEDGKTKYPLQGAHIQCFAIKDSTKCKETTSEATGSFHFPLITTEKEPKFRIRISYVGMEPFEKIHDGKFTVGQFGMKEVHLDTIIMKALPITLEEAIIVGKLKKMYMEGDTVIFNTDAYKMPDGSLLLELVRRLPGLRCSPNGNLTYKGKSIKEIRLNGASFFRNDMTVALRNIPANRLEQLKIYDTNREDSISNPEKMTVLDMKTKKPVDKVKMANAVAAIQSTDHRHLLDASVNSYLKDKTELSVRGESINTSDSYSIFSNSGGFLLDNELFPVKSKEKLEQGGELSIRHQFKNIELDASVEYNRQKDIGEQLSLSAVYQPTFNRFDYAEQQSEKREESVLGELNLKGQLSANTIWKAGVNINFSKGENRTDNHSAMFKEDPSTLTDGNPLHTPEATLSDILLNRTERYTIGKEKSQNIEASFGMEHTLGKGDKRLMWEVASLLEEGKNREISYDRSRYYEFEDSLTLYNRYIETPVMQRQLRARLDYAQQIGNKSRLTTSYIFTHDYRNDKNRYYNLNQWDEASTWENITAYNLSSIDSLSRTGITRQTKHCFRMNLHTEWDRLELNARIEITPTHMEAQTELADGVTTQDTSFLAVTYNPQLNLTYKQGKNKVELSYKGFNQLPAIGSLLTITDYRNPLYIQEGNPNLKQAYSNSLNLTYSHGTYQMTVEWGNTINGISYLREYNEQTGVTRVRPENINGNWMVKTDIDLTKPVGDFSLDLYGEYKFEQQMEYIQTTAQRTSQKSATHTQSVTLMPAIKYASESIESTLIATYKYNHTQNGLLDDRLKTQDYNIWWDCSYTFPFHLSLHSSYLFIDRTGYNMSEMNKKEHIWNIGISYRFMKEKRARIRAEFYDVLHQRSNLTHTTSAYGWNELKYSKINSYFLLSFSYQLSSFL